MSSNSQTFSNGQQMQVNTTLAKLFPYKKEFISYTVNNSTYDDLVLTPGLVMGVVSATGLAKGMVSTATDGSQNAMGILGTSTTIPAGESQVVQIMVDGEVRQDMVIFANGTDTLATIVNGRRVFETLLAAGTFLRGVRNATNYDNALG